MARARRNTGSDFNRWDIWWERNKYSIFNLRKIYDERSIPVGENPDKSYPTEEARLREIEAFKKNVLIPSLIKLLGHNHFDVRSAAAISLGKLQAREAVPYLRNLIRDGSPVVRVSALFALGLMGEARSTYILLNLAHNSRYGQKIIGRTSVLDGERGYAAMAMAIRDSHVTSSDLSQFLDKWSNIEPDYLVLLIEAAGLDGDENLISCLTRILRNRKNNELIRSTAATSLGKIGDPAAIPVLLESLNDRLSNVRRSAAIALGNLVSQGDSEAIGRMIRLLETDNDIPLKNFLIISLGRIGGVRAKQTLTSLFSKGPYTLRPWAALGLGLACRKTKEESVVRILAEALKSDSNPDHQGAMAIALGIIAPEEAPPLLAGIARSARNTTLKGHAALALAMTGATRHAEDLKQIMLSATDPHTIRSAALGLGVLSDSGSGHDLVGMIRNSNNPYIQSYTAVALGFLGDFEVAQTLLDIAVDPRRNPISAAYAVNALGILFDHERIPALARVAQNSNYLADSASIEWVLNIGI